MRGTSIKAPGQTPRSLFMDVVFIALGVVMFAAFGLYAAYLRTI